MVTNRAGLHADDVVNGDVSGCNRYSGIGCKCRTSYFIQCVDYAWVSARSKEWPWQEVVTPLSEPGTAVVPLETANPAEADEIRRRMAELDMSNTQSIISFGSGAQAELQVISQEMLQGVKNKDVGPAGDALREIVSTIRGFSSEEMDLGRERSWWDKLTGQAAPIAQFVARYEEVQGQIDGALKQCRIAGFACGIQNDGKARPGFSRLHVEFAQ